MIKHVLYNSKNSTKSAYLWNTSAAMLNAFQTVFILMLISRIDPVVDAGVFTIAFAIGNLMLTIGKYGMRQFQVSDVDEKYSFKEYLTSRIITTIIMIFISVLYVGYNGLSGLYNLEKCTVVILICFARVVDAFEDVMHGMLQQYTRLDVAGKILTVRQFFYIITYMLVYFVTQNLVITSAVALILSMILFIMLNTIALKDFKINKKSFNYKNIGKLFVECFPLFISSYLIMYISNAPKYAIDKVMSSEAQACFTYIFMPVFVISLLSQFVYQPVINRMAFLWHNNNLKEFTEMIFRQIGIILLLAVCAVIGGYLLGIPILSLIYGVDLREYKIALVILLIGGGALAFVNFLQMIITVTRKQNLLIIGYLLAYLAFIIGGKLIVSGYGIIGISIFYTVVVVGIGIVFAMITIGILRKSIRIENR